MSDITSDPSARDPLAIIRDACVKARAAGAVVTTTPDLGVVCTSTELPTWETESSTPILSPLGAVLMVHQPRIPVADEALGHVLGVGPIWVCGFDDGVTGGDPGASAIVRGPAVRLYGDGYRAGSEFRARWAIPSPLGRPELVPPEPAKLIPRLLASLTISDALEALAATVPGRGWSAEQAADVVEDLREQAALYRAEGR